MKRMKIYAVPHKGLRNALSQLSLLAGETNYAEVNEVETLRELGNAVFTILSIHAADEDNVTLSELELRCPGCSDHDKEDHIKIHTAQHKLEELLEKIYANGKAGKDVTDDGAEFYLAFSEFHSAYLEHTAEEERVTQPLLWAHFSDEELAEHRVRIMAQNPPETLLIWFRFVLPAQSHAERVGLLSGFKKAAPPEFFNKALDVVQQYLPAQQFGELISTLAN